jgi:hypothetical protein
MYEITFKLSNECATAIAIAAEPASQRKRPHEQFLSTFPAFDVVKG